ncbi:MAG: hypothetical protein U0228_09325 [Myxococcaceae bacterium]
MSSPSTTPQRPWPTEALARGVLFGSLALGVVLKARVVFTDDGINWPDEIYQSFEPAHRLVFGHGLVAWEFIEGARTWAVPGFVAVWLWLCKLFGAGPGAYIAVVKLAFVALSGAASLGAWRLARAFGARELEAATASALWSLCALSLYFSPRAMAENLAAPLVVWGLALLFDPQSSRRVLWVGASLLGLATIARLQCGVVCVGALAAVPFVRPGDAKAKRRDALEVFGVLVLWALVFGTWDALAWHDVPTAKAGGFFHSAVVYWRFNIVENRGAGWGTAPWTYFFQHLWLTMPGVTAVLGVSALASLRRAWPAAVVLVLFLALHLFVAHKELRFMLPVLPVACALFGVAASLAPEKGGRGLVVLAGLCVAVSAWNHKALTMGDVGSYPERAGSSAWDDFGPVNRLLLAASRQSDVCGLRIDAAHLAWTGGSTYLHHKAPLYMPGFPPQHGFFNYAIVFAGSGAPVVAKEGSLELVKIAPSCVPDVNYAWRLP